MLRAFSDLKRMSIGATDGEIGSVKDAYFDDQRWALRYLVAATGGWFTLDRVLISPLSISGVEWQHERIDVSLTREQVRNAPGIDTEKPVSRQQESAYFDYYGYPYYWSGPMMWGPVPRPLSTGLPTAAPEANAEARKRERERADPHLRSASEVAGYHIEAHDGSIGHVENFLFDDDEWSLRYFIVDTRNWLPGRKVLISTDWIDRVSWGDRKVFVTLLREEVRNSPVYDPESLTASEEESLYKHYGRTRPDPTRIQIR